MLRRYAAQAPSRVPMMNDRIVVTPTRTIVQGAASLITSVTVYG